MMEIFRKYDLILLRIYKLIYLKNVIPELQKRISITWKIIFVHEFFVEIKNKKMKNEKIKNPTSCTILIEVPIRCNRR